MIAQQETIHSQIYREDYSLYSYHSPHWSTCFAYAESAKTFFDCKHLCYYSYIEMIASVDANATDTKACYFVRKHRAEVKTL